MSGFGKFLKKLQPLKVLEQGAEIALKVLPKVKTTAEAITSAGDAIRARKESGESSTQSFLGGIQDTLQQPLKAQNAGLLILLGLGVVLVIVLVRKR